VGTAASDKKYYTSKIKFESSRTGVSNTAVHLNGLAHIKQQVYGECFNPYPANVENMVIS
jgi:hypothetical protein